MIKKEKFLSIVFLNALIALVVDALTGVQSNYMNVIYVMLIDLPILYVLFMAVKGKNWAYLTGLIYTLFRSFNYYFDSFTLYTKNGLNIEVSVNNIGINIISFLLLIFYVFDFYKRYQNGKLRTGFTATFIVLTLILSFGAITTKEAKSNPITYFNNTLTVNPEHCNSWGLPPTSFTIEYPDYLEPELNADNSYYVRFRNMRDQQVIQEITVGTIGEIRSNDQALEALNLTDSSFKNMEGIIYQNQQLGIQLDEEFAFPTLKALINFDGLNMPILSGWYSANLFFILPTTQNLSGVNISFTHELIGQEDATMNILEQKMLKSLQLKTQ